MKLRIQRHPSAEPSPAGTSFTSSHLFLRLLSGTRRSQRPPSLLGSRRVPLNGSRRREEADSSSLQRNPPPHVGGYGKAVHCQSRRGIALVITLILLAIITTLAIAFLGLTRGETKSVDAMNRTTDAEMAADSALERARAEILAPFITRNNAFPGTERLGPDFMVSVAWDNNRNRTNSYGAFRNPSPPVFVKKPDGTTDDRFYLDLNRNTNFEATGYVPVTDNNFNQVGNQTNWMVGDPQWIGVLQDPRRGHDTNNAYIARYAFMVQPVGRSLDANWIHNEGVARTTVGASGFYREQGVGSWELNLAAFLADLNFNEWNTNTGTHLPYSYASTSAVGSPGGVGDAFNDASELLKYRYGGTRNNLDWADRIFLGAGSKLEDDQIDLFANGFSSGPNPDANDFSNQPWPGADSRNHFFSLHDFFNATKLPKLGAPDQFRDRMRNASVRGNSYDRYTYYRMLAQMGTDSAEEDEGKVNINFVNVRSWATGERIFASDLIPWSTNSAVVQVPRLGPVNMGRPVPEIFFLTVFTNLLAREPDLAFMVTNRIDGTLFSAPIFTNRSTYTTNTPFNEPLYTARLHQLLQITANIFDATTTNKVGEAFPYFPTVFRPFFTESNGNVYITDYGMMDETADAFRTNPDYKWVDLDTSETLSTPQGSLNLVFGIPLIVGARSGLPSFNELGVVSLAQATRKLEMARSTPGTPTKKWDRLEQQFRLQARTMLQIEARNSHTNRYPRALQMVTESRPYLELKERTNGPAIVQTDWKIGSTNFYAASSWNGEVVGAENTNFVLSPLFVTNLLDLLIVTNAESYLPTNQWTMTLTNRLLFYLVDRSVTGGRIIDAVSLNRPHNVFQIGSLLDSPLDEEPELRNIWNSAKDRTVTFGIMEQIRISQDPTLTPEGVWGNWEDSAHKEKSAENFRTFYGDESILKTNQVPFTPSRLLVQADYYLVDDPLVHYTFEDLYNDPSTEKKKYGSVELSTGYTNVTEKMSGKDVHSKAWNKGALGAATSEEEPGLGTLDPTIRDPGIIHPFYWNFPTNLFPSIGWLGRVHRGTPWQTIYLKSRGVSATANWIDHTGNQRASHPASANQMQPVRDWELLDVFTTAPHQNATRGRLSINQTNPAAWSAVLSGVLASGVEPDPDLDGFLRPTASLMSPAAVNSTIQLMVQSINTNRMLFNSNALNRAGQFHGLGQMLAAPELTDASPILNANPALFDPYKPHGNARIYDEDYERIPQQILSLLKVGEPRFVIYAWGQSLKPAKRDPEDNGPSIQVVTEGTPGNPDYQPKGLVRNYQITGEMATRAVIRVEFDRFSNGQINYARPHAVVESFNVLPVE